MLTLTIFKKKKNATTNFICQTPLPPFVAAVVIRGYLFGGHHFSQPHIIYKKYIPKKYIKNFYTPVWQFPIIVVSLYIKTLSI